MRSAATALAALLRDLSVSASRCLAIASATLEGIASLNESLGARARELWRAST
jgi:hypothetical protein